MNDPPTRPTYRSHDSTPLPEVKPAPQRYTLPSFDEVIAQHELPQYSDGGHMEVPALEIVDAHFTGILRENQTAPEPAAMNIQSLERLQGGPKKEALLEAAGSFQNETHARSDGYLKSGIPRALIGRKKVEDRRIVELLINHALGAFSRPG